MVIYYLIVAFILLLIFVIRYKSRDSIDDQLKSIIDGDNYKAALKERKKVQKKESR